MTDILRDDTLLNCIEQLMREQKLPFDLQFGRLLMTINPAKPLRPQLSAGILPLYPTLVAERMTK